jgi:hypothetical protein
MGSGPHQHRANHVGNRQQLRGNAKHMAKARPAKIVGRKPKPPATRKRAALASINGGRENG